MMRLHVLVASVGLTVVAISVSVLGCSGGRKVSEADALRAAMEYQEKIYNIQLKELCTHICVTYWGAWSRCTQPCGGGTQRRTREQRTVGQCKTLDKFVCPHQLSHTQGCNEGCPHGGHPDAKKTGCRCKDGRKGTCCESEVTCPFPRQPSNGRVQGSLTTHQAMVTFSCNEGYTLVGTEQLRCEASGKWSDQIPTCGRVECPMPESGDKMEVHLNGRNYGDKVFYSCEDGHELRGPPERVCQRNEGAIGRWSGYTPSCRPVSCGDPDVLINGQRNGNDFTYGKEVTFSCRTGYHLEGSHQMTCLASGRWLGTPPRCIEITCDAPLQPRNGEVTSRSLTFGTLISFECHPGYNLVGNRVLQCTGEGDWNGTEPICKAAICGVPAVPEHGSKDGSIYYFPHNVTYSCFNGYLLQGARQVMCQTDASWSAGAPSCEPCPNNTYMAEATETEESGSCVPCPNNSHTVTTGSTTIHQCICSEGYAGEPGGPCIEIDCPLLKAPGNGSMAECDNHAGDTCTFSCNDGYIMDRGSSKRSCQASGLWDGKEPRCAPCMMSTYKSDERSCLPCPPNSHTGSAQAQMLEGCVCMDGYRGPAGGPCEDVDECVGNEGRGDCEDLCENSQGSYRCSCSIPGYGLDPKNRHNCIVEKQCQNLTDAEAPRNGGLVCHWYREENSQQCTAKCNNGYEFPSRINAYEHCGPLSGYIWTFQNENPNATFHPCIEEFFPGFRTEANSAYFTRDCQDLNETEQEEVKESFLQVLNQEGVCKKRNTKVCEIKDIGIICGRRTLRRRKRGVIEELSSLDMAFNVSAFKIKNNTRDCPHICTFLRIPEDFCSELCLPTYKRFLKASVQYAKRMLEQIYRTRRERMQFQAANREFEPETNGLRTSEVITECEPGQADRNGTCVPCERGSYYSSELNECVACPVGTYQLFEAQTVCVPCPEGSTTSKNGSLFCTECTGNSYGPMCQSTCECEHGTCDQITGQCLCENGWEGDRCDIDIPGCRDGACFDGVVCQDVPAPGSGFRCGVCPTGFSGDGQSCAILRHVNEL